MPRARERKKRSSAARPAPGRPATPDARAAGPAGPADPPSVAVAGFELSELRRLIRLVQRTGIGELELNAGGRSVRISATPANGGTTIALPGGSAGAGTHGAHAPAAANPPAAGAAEPAPSPPRTDQKAITSPMVGTFYRSPAPDADPFVEVGDVIEVGQTVCIIEAMKLMNEIEAETKGRVAQILVENTQPVEFGQKLFLIDPL